jgi:glycosyltransferase involved in cell wall biosynthesis
MVNYIRYPTDIPYSLGELFKYYDKADVVAIHSSFDGHHWYDNSQGKPTVLMHHGYHDGHFYTDIHGMVAEATQLNAVQIGTTVNLELLTPVRHLHRGRPADRDRPSPFHVTWTPTPYDLPTLAAYQRKLHQPDPDGPKVVRFLHAPTNRAIKSTDLIIETFARLRARGLPVKLVLIERQSHGKTLKAKAQFADVLIDQLKLGYGCNAIEAWAMGIPVIGGVSEHPDWRAHMVARYGLTESPTGLPFYETDEAKLPAAIEAFALSADLRKEWSAIGQIHVQRHHSEAAAIKTMSEVYEAALSYPSVPSDPALSRRWTHKKILNQIGGRIK